MFALHVVQAEEGDCLLLQSDQAFILIDGGPTGTFTNHLGPTLADRKVTRLDLVVLTHVDGDHVAGLIDLLAKRPTRPIGCVWHNAFSAQVGEKIEKRVVEIVTPEAKRSIAQGNTLAGLVSQIPLNPGFPGGLVSVESAGKPRPFGALQLQVVGPDATALTRLRKDWSKWLTKARRVARGKAKPDVSVTNRSSIVLLAKSESKSMLLTGDSRWDEVLSGLEAARVLDGEGRIHVDVLKVQHHGSMRNAKPEFFQRVTADKYVISANGRYDNPDVDTLLWIVDAAVGRTFEIIVTNVPTQVKTLLKRRPPKDYGYSLRTIPQGKHFVTVTPKER
jgi:beta-lactamase superfamily II metal-dependent hydrolase